MRWADLDALNHVNNVVYVDYLQEARIDMLRLYSPGSRAEDLAEGLVVAHHDIAHLAPLLFRFDPVSIECWVSEIKAASFTMDYEIFTEDADGGRVVHCRARTVLVPYVFATERPRRLRADERTALTRLLEPGEPIAFVQPAAPVEVPGGEYSISVRFSDVDSYRHVNNVKYVEYVQEARVWLLHHSGAGAVESSTTPIVIARTRMDYLAPLLQREEPYLARTWVSHVGRTSMTMETVFLDGDTVHARAQVVAVAVTPDTGRPTPISDEVRALLQRTTA